MTANPLTDAISRLTETGIAFGVALRDSVAADSYGLDVDAARTDHDAAVTELLAVVLDSRADLAAVGVAATGEAVR